MLFGARLRFSNSSGLCPQPNEHHNSLLSGNFPRDSRGMGTAVPG
jgi:hypothetical protein